MIFTNSFMISRSILRYSTQLRCASQCRSAHTFDKSILKKRTKRGTTDFTSRDHVLHKDIVSMLQAQQMSLEQVSIPEELLFEYLFAKTRRVAEIDNVKIVATTSEGEGLGLIPRSTYDSECTDSATTVVKVPKTVPGDIVKVKLQRHHEYYAEAELLSVSRKSKRNSLRNDRLVVCEHFSECSGCQLQMLPYEAQLDFKRNIIKRAYDYFFPAFKQDKVESFGAVVESPMQYAYRSKITPHTRVTKATTLEDLPLPIGFEHVNYAKPVVSINRCPIATATINQKLPESFANLNMQMERKLRGETDRKVSPNLILRDSIRIDHKTGEFENVCLTDPRLVATEKIGDHVFQFPVNEFFQNNRSILPSFLEFIKHHLRDIKGGYTNIVDTYCGSGFLGISLSNTLPEEGKVFGIEISERSIEYAKHNAGINGIKVPEKMVFLPGSSDSIFSHKAFIKSGITGDDCVVLMNPSRKGSNSSFSQQLVQFKPKAIVYVSCNVFTQARDLAELQELAARSGLTYNIKTVTGFDFYPQTKHVEVVAVAELQ